MNIAVYDIEHFETMYATTKIWETPENNITLFTTAEMVPIIKELLGDGVQQVTIIQKRKKSLFFIIDIYRYCRQQKIDILFLNTVTYHHILWASLCFFLTRTRTYLTIHEVHNFFSPTFSFNPKSMLRFFGKKWLAKTVTGYTTLLTVTQQYMREKKRSKKPVYVLPGGVFIENKINEIEPALHFTIVIPGSIDKRRRNYDLVIDLAKALNHNNTSFKLVLLGTATDKSGAEIIHKVQQLNYQNIDICCFDQFVMPAEYEHYLGLSDVILLPLLAETINEKIPELYGLTKSSGTFFDAVRHAKPILLPASIPLSPEIQNQCIQYTNVHELTTFINQLATQKTFLHLWKSKASANAQQFQPHFIRERLMREMF